MKNNKHTRTIKAKFWMVLKFNHSTWFITWFMKVNTKISFLSKSMWSSAAGAIELKTTGFKRQKDKGKATSLIKQTYKCEIIKYFKM